MMKDLSLADAGTHAGTLARAMKLRWLLPAMLFATILPAADYPDPVEGDFAVRDFRFHGGDTLPELRLHYTTIGTPGKDAVLLLHGTGGSGAQFQSKQFGGELFGPGQLLDARTHYIIMPDNIGHGKSSKPSDGLHTRFPRYGYEDMVAAQHRLLTEKLGVAHLRLILGTSMGCMHAWIWGSEYPEFMDALMPLACQPYPITGRNYLWRRMALDLIRNDPTYHDGDYSEQPPALQAAGYIQTLMTSNTQDLQKRGATRADAERVFEQIVANPANVRCDANDYIYAVESSSDYDPRPGLSKIKAAVFAINFADDPVNPPELGIFEREVRKAPHAKYRMMPGTPETHGHGTHTWAAFWKQYLAELLNETDARPGSPTGLMAPRR
jgi:homoserine O-acetyltransferase